MKEAIVVYWCRVRGPPRGFLIAVLSGGDGKGNMPNGFLPMTDDGLLSFASNFVENAAVTPSAFGLTTAQVGAYEAAFNAYRDALLVARNEATRTRLTIGEKDVARDALRLISRQLAKVVEATVSVTDNQKRALRLNVRKKPSPIPMTNERPVNRIVGVDGRTVTVGIQAGTEQTKTARPKGIVSTLVYYFVGETYSSDPMLWSFWGATTEHKPKVTLPDSVPAGSQVWFLCSWLSARGETSMPSMPVSTFIAGGNVGSMAIKAAA